MTSESAIATNFLAEAQVLDDLVQGLDDAGWRRPTPAPRWTIAHQIAHLLWTDEVALLAVTDPAAFEEAIAQAAKNPLGHVDEQADELAQLEADELLERWRTARSALGSALDAADPGVKLPWFGPPMAPRSMATARLMETWAHGQDVADALDARREPTARLRDIAHLGVRTRDFAYRINGLESPANEFRIELQAPDSADVWEWGPPDAAGMVRGTAEDFCLLVTQRREPEQTALEFTGEAAHWATFAQAFAGAPKSAVRGRA